MKSVVSNDGSREHMIACINTRQEKDNNAYTPLFLIVVSKIIRKWENTQ